MHDVASAAAAVVVLGSVVFQDCILQDNLQAHGIHVMPTGELTVTGTTIRRCSMGLLVMSKAVLGKSCSITACAMSGGFAMKHGDGPAEVTVESGADVVCEGNSTSSQANKHEYAAYGGTIKGVAEEKVTIL